MLSDIMSRAVKTVYFGDGNQYGSDNEDEVEAVAKRVKRETNEEIQHARRQLPIYEAKTALVEEIRKHQVSIGSHVSAFLCG